MLIPRPTSYTPRPAGFTLTPGTTVSAPLAGEVATLLRELLGPATGLSLPEHPAGTPNDPVSGGSAGIVLRIDPDAADLGEEGYRLTVSPSGVDACAGTTAGLRWAVQTLRQLLPVEVYSPVLVDGVEWTVAGADIVDRPAYPWRGAMLDVGRWYKPVEWLYTFVDLLAMHRMNVFHLHLTEDQGWRFEVKRYPRLTAVGGFRRESPLGHENDNVGDATPHGGYYTQTQLRDLVAYASRRGVTIVPEIDLPGHTQAAIAAYPELGDDPEARLEVWTRFGVSAHVLNTRDATVAFIRDVLDELLDVFPSPYIHLGGDEVPVTEWSANPLARQRMADAGLTEPDELLGWWIGQLAAHLARHGRTAVVWDELVGHGAPADAVIMAWRGQDRVAEALRAGHRVVATPHTHMYLNYPASDSPGEPLSIADGGYADVTATPLSTMYAYDPAPAGQAVIGVQANLWTEYAASPRRAEYDLMPRLAAVAEVAWGSDRDEPDLLRRLASHLRRLDHAGITYRPLDGVGANDGDGGSESDGGDSAVSDSAVSDSAVGDSAVVDESLVVGELDGLPAR